MLKDIITEQGYTVYRVSKDTGIPYSTLVDLVSGKTSMENTSAGTLNRLSAYLNMSMERIYHSNDPSSLIYLYNEGRTVHVDFQDYKMEYLGPKNLVAFKRINRVQNGMICVDTYFYDTDNTIYTEEDYVDLTDVFGDYDLEGILPENIEVRIGKPGRAHKDRLIDEALLISDSLAVSYEYDSNNEINILIVSLHRPQYRMRLKLSDFSILHTNMSKTMRERAINIVKRNSVLLHDLIQREEAEHA